jgi:hypothetical protein
LGGGGWSNSRLREPGIALEHSLHNLMDFISRPVAHLQLLEPCEEAVEPADLLSPF